MGEFAKNLKFSLDNGDNTSIEAIKLKNIIDITKEDVVETEYHENFLKLYDNYESILNKQKVEPHIAAKANLNGIKFMNKMNGADNLLQFMIPIIQQELEINTLIKDTYDTINALLYGLEFDNSITINKRIEVEDEKFKITDEQNLIEFKSSLLKIKDRFDKTYKLK